MLLGRDCLGFQGSLGDICTGPGTTSVTVALLLFWAAPCFAVRGGSAHCGMVKQRLWLLPTRCQEQIHDMKKNVFRHCQIPLGDKTAPC